MYFSYYTTVIFTIIDSQAETSEAENSSTSSSSHTARPELQDVLMKLFPVADKWENIGIMVGIEPDKLNAVKEGNSSSQNCLCEMLKIWVKQVNPSPTWTAIRVALETVGEEKLAGNLT